MFICRTKEKNKSLLNWKEGISMIQPKTLEALNYFLNESISRIEDEINEIKGENPESKLLIFKTGKLTGLKESLHLINCNWKLE